jgi:holo-[acyl-carrier protein] synthase
VTACTILGTGVDLVENERIGQMLLKWGGRFKDRVFLPSEQQYCDSKAVPTSYYAGRFAVKEAVSKAFGTGMGAHINWLDIEVIRHPSTGAPSVLLSRHGRQFADSMNAGEILISLSHTHNYAIAHAFLLGR